MIAAWMARYALAAAVAFAAMAGWSVYWKQKGVSAERSRVEAKGKATDAKAKIARKKAEATPHDSLRAYCRDC